MDGKPCPLPLGGFAKKTTKYDDRSNWTAEEYYGCDGQRCLTKDGFAKKVAEYDANSNLVKEAYFGLRDEPAYSDGVHEAKMTYDERGNRIEEAYFDETGKPTANQDGVAQWTAKYSEGGNLLDKTYFDRDGNAVAVEPYVDDVQPGGQAKEAGLIKGDVLVSYDGKAVRNLEELQTRIKMPGDTLRELIVSRNGRRLSFKMKPGLMGILISVRAVPAPGETKGSIK
jgi:PDZ domain